MDLTPDSNPSLGATGVMGSATWIWDGGDASTAANWRFGKTFTLAVALGPLVDPVELIAWKTTQGVAALRLSVDLIEGRLVLSARLTMDFNPTPIGVSVPLDSIGRDGPHVALVRYHGFHLELFVDGVLVDEEWPLGRLSEAAPGVAIEVAAVQQIAAWDRPISGAEILALSGGAERVARLADNYLGPRRPVGQYWRPRGINVNVGDCMPFFHDGRFHLFYLVDRHHHASMWGCGGHQWAHASTTDLVHWDEHPLAVAIDGDLAGSICTGSVFFHDGLHYAFYAVRMADRSPSPLCFATAEDGIHFTKNNARIALQAPYLTEAARDPVVFRDPGESGFRMLVTTALVEPGTPETGCLAQLVSTDLRHWQQLEPFLVPGYRDQPECPDFFEWNGWYYLVFGSEGVARYRMSRHPRDGWEQPAVDVFDGRHWRVMKTASFQTSRRIGAGFVPDGGYGGWAAFREIHQRPDGTLGTSWPPEMIPSCPDATPFKPTPVRETAMLERLEGMPSDFLLRARAEPSAEDAIFGLKLRASADAGPVAELRFDSRRRRISFGGPGFESDSASEWTAIEGVDCWNRTFAFSLVVKDAIADLCIDSLRTLIARIPRAPAADTIFSFSTTGEPPIKGVEILPLSTPSTSASLEHFK